MKKVIYKDIQSYFFQEWVDLWNRSPHANYTNSPYWFLAVTESFSYNDAVIIAFYENDKLTGVAPLIKQKKFGVKVYTVPPGDCVSGIPFLIDLDNNAMVKSLLAEFVKLGSVFLDNIDERFFNTLSQKNSDVESVSHTLHFSMSIKKDENGTCLISNRKKMLHKIRDRENDFLMKSFDGRTLEGLMKVFNIDEKSAKQNSGYCPFSSPQIKHFYTILAKHFQRHLVINILYFKNTPIAYEIGFMVGKTYFGDQIGYVADFRQYTPGKIIAVKLLDYLATRNIEVFDFGSGDSHLKRALTPQYDTFHQIILSKNHLTKNYLRFICQSKVNLFNILSNNKKVYSVYRNFKNIFSK